MTKTYMCSGGKLVIQVGADRLEAKACDGAELDAQVETYMCDGEELVWDDYEWAWVSESFVLKYWFRGYTVETHGPSWSYWTAGWGTLPYADPGDAIREVESMVDALRDWGNV